MRRRILILAMVLMAAGCGEKKQAETVLGPEETVIGFFKAVAGGDAETALSLCDAETMGTYIDTYVAALNSMTKKDSSATAIASSLLADADIVITDNTKEGDKRLISYAVEFGDGLTKRKTATVKKEGGAWKVERITDSL